MKIKKGVIIAGLKIEMRTVLRHAEEVFEEYGQELVITSGLDGVHSAGSYHYYGYAVDLRTRDMNKPDKEMAAKRLHHFLINISHKYDVVLESDHIHVEYEA